MVGKNNLFLTSHQNKFNIIFKSMKTTTFIICLFSLLQLSCTAQKKSNTLSLMDAKQNEHFSEITLTKQSRGSQESFKIQGEHIVYQNNNRTQKKELKTSDWNNLNDLVQKINLKKINSYESPTQNRFNDAAPSSEISILTDQKNTYTSKSFDFGNPPAELQELYHEIIRLTQDFQTKNKPSIPRRL